jgi:hypothetical protein
MKEMLIRDFKEIAGMFEQTFILASYLHDLKWFYNVIETQRPVWEGQESFISRLPTKSSW